MSTSAFDHRRSARTRQAVVRAFTGLVLERRYDKIRVGDIVERAEVGRSTFYDHYSGKDEVLLDSLRGLLGVLADCVRRDHDPQPLARAVEHFWENRRFAKRLLFDRHMGLVVRQLAREIEPRLLAEGRVGAADARLTATQIAAGQIGLLECWLTGEAPATNAQVATILRRAASS